MPKLRSSVADPDPNPDLDPPDPLVCGPPGSGSTGSMCFWASWIRIWFHFYSTPICTQFKEFRWPAILYLQGMSLHLCYFGIPLYLSLAHVFLHISGCVSILSTRWQHIFLWCIFPLLLPLYVQDVHPFYMDGMTRLYFFRIPVSLCSGCASFLRTG